jgi:hypothetical protein
MLARRARRGIYSVCACFLHAVLESAIVECITTPYTRFEDRTRMLITINPHDARLIYQQIC